MLLKLKIFVFIFMCAFSLISTASPKIDAAIDKCDKGEFMKCQLLGDYFLSKKEIDKATTFYGKGCRANLDKSCEYYECYSGTYASCYHIGDKLKEATPEKAKPYFKMACEGEIEAGCHQLKEKDDSLLLMWAAVILIGIAVLIVTRTMFQDESQFKASEQLEDASVKQNLAQHGIVLKYSRPFFKRYISPVVGSMKAKKKIREKYRRVLFTSGISDLMTPDDFFSFKLFLIIGFPIVFLAVRAFLEESWSLSFIPIISIVGYFYPDLWVKGKVEQRQKEVLLSMPFCVDMLALSVEAGLDFVAAMQKVMEKAKRSPLVDEFEIMLREIKIGSSRAEALRSLAWRVDLIQISSFCATLIAADSVGASIGPILKNLSNDIRTKKSSEVEKEGAKAATKILFPMLFLIVPAVLIVVFAPLMLQMMGG